MKDMELDTEELMKLAKVYGADPFGTYLVLKIDECDDILDDPKASKEEKLLAEERKKAYQDAREKYNSLDKGNSGLVA